MGINWTEILISMCTLLISTLLVPLIRNTWQQKKNELELQNKQDQIDTIEYWVDVAVRWAKQWLQSETGVKKKEEVLKFVSRKLDELNIKVSAEDLDKIIEAVYEQVKTETQKIM